MKLSKEEALPCPYCGSQPNLRMSKTKHCQAHGEPYQDYIILCESKKCFMSPKTQHHIKRMALRSWNQRKNKDENL